VSEADLDPQGQVAAPPWEFGKDITESQLAFLALRFSREDYKKVLLTLESEKQITVVADSPPTQTGPVLTLTSIQPDSAGNWDVEVVALGSGFTPNTKLYGNETLGTTTYYSANELRGIFPGIAAAGVYQITAREGTSKSNALQFTAF